MKKTETLPLFLQKTFNLFIFSKFFILIIIVFMCVTSCKKTSTPAPTAATSNTSISNDSIIYKSYVVDSVNFSSDSIMYDVNNDNINDILVTMQHTINGNTMNYSGNISGINNSIDFCYINTQSSWSMLALNDTINGVKSFNWNPVCSYSGSCPYFAGSNSWAQGIFTKYFGFNITLNSTNYYGWFHFKYQSISETGINLSTNKTIKIGQKL